MSTTKPTEIADRRFTTVHDRYQVCDPRLCEQAGYGIQRKADALAEAHRLAAKRGYAMEVYDVMARRGSVRSWRVEPDGDVCAATDGDRR